MLLDAWIPCDFIIVKDTHAVSAALHRSLAAINVSGAVFRNMTVERSEIFLMSDPLREIPLPDLVQLSIEAVVAGPSGWYLETGTCDVCGRPLWDLTDGGRAALASAKGRLRGAPRQISGAAWQGEDFFWTTDPGPPLITERVKEILDRHETPELILHPAQFV